mmetsp:Transcript_5440/g.11455  ORF Transcript_5440/g.11455 Transcript_5440/m.11455 type:complete len:83 (-) Transcript_5440:1154-1402(-)
MHGATNTKLKKNDASRKKHVLKPADVLQSRRIAAERASSSSLWWWSSGRATNHRRHRFHATITAQTALYPDQTGKFALSHDP